MTKNTASGACLRVCANIRLGWKGLSGTNTLAYFTWPHDTQHSYTQLSKKSMS